MKMNGSGSGRGVQPGGAGSETQRYFAFTAPAGGTLTVTSSNTGSSADDTRMVTVSLDGTVVASQPGGSPTSAPTVTTFDISAAGQVKIYPTGNALRFYKIEFASVSAVEPEPEPKTLTLTMAELHAAGTTGMPTGTDATVALGESWSSWSWNSINFESRCALTTSGDAAGTKVPVFYLYKISKVAAGTFVRNTTPLGEIKTVTVTLIDNGAKKGSYFTMSESVAGVKQTVLSSNDNAANVEHVYTFSAGNDGTFEFANPSDQDCKVISIVIDYVQ